MNRWFLSLLRGNKDVNKGNKETRIPMKLAGYVNAVTCSGIKMVLLVTYILMRSKAFYDLSLRYLTAKSFFVH